MARKLRILHLGNENYLEKEDIPENIKIDEYTIEDLENIDIKTLLKYMKKEKIKYDLTLVTDNNTLAHINKIDAIIEPYRIIVDSSLILNESSEKYLYDKCAFKQDLRTDKEKLLKKFLNSFYSGQSYGAKFHVKDIEVNSLFTGKVEFIGSDSLSLSGDFGDDFVQVARWKYNLPFGTPIEIWPKYSTSGNVEIKYNFQTIYEGGSDIYEDIDVTEEQLKEPILFDYDFGVYMYISILAKGNGQLNIGPLHYRESRYEFGDFVVGGKLFRDKERDEFAYYFNPGDLKPPLNVYFSGYRTLEGFEGYGLIKSLGSPFILITDPRLEGGSFYLGTQEYSNKIRDVILHYLNKLNFTKNDLILTGSSMGTFGAMYYGSMLSPNAIIVSKPIGNLGRVALMERTIRPGIFATSLDVLKSKVGGTSDEDVEKLDNLFWDVFLKGDFSETKLIIAYLRHEDYDNKVVHDIVKRLRKTNAKIIIKGVDGRHMDNHDTVINWYYNYYKQYLKTNFGR